MYTPHTVGPRRSEQIYDDGLWMERKTSSSSRVFLFNNSFLAPLRLPSKTRQTSLSFKLSSLFLRFFSRPQDDLVTGNTGICSRSFPSSTSSRHPLSPLTQMRHCPKIGEFSSSSFYESQNEEEGRNEREKEKRTDASSIRLYLLSRASCEFPPLLPFFYTLPCWVSPLFLPVLLFPSFYERGLPQNRPAFKPGE